MEEVPAQNSVQSVGSRLNNLGQNFKNRLPKWPIYYWIFIVVAIITLILVVIYFSLSPQSRQELLQKRGSTSVQQGENTWEPAKPSLAPLASGKQVYMISGGKPGAPQMTMASIDPLDVKKGQTQTFALQARDDKEITDISTEIITDNGKEKYSLKLEQGTNKEGVWVGTWKISDSFDYQYQIVIKAKNSENLESTVTLTFR